MKKGKRQIMAKPIDFNDTDTPASASAIFNNYIQEDSHDGDHHQNIINEQQPNELSNNFTINTVVHQKEYTEPKIQLEYQPTAYLNNRQEQKVQKPVEGKQDDRKKRLKMMKQRYLQKQNPKSNTTVPKQGRIDNQVTTKPIKTKQQIRPNYPHEKMKVSEPVREIRINQILQEQYDNGNIYNGNYNQPKTYKNTQHTQHTKDMFQNSNKIEEKVINDQQQNDIEIITTEKPVKNKLYPSPVPRVLPKKYSRPPPKIPSIPTNYSTTETDPIPLQISYNQNIPDQKYEIKKEDNYPVILEQNQNPQNDENSEEPDLNIWINCQKSDLKNNYNNSESEKQWLQRSLSHCDQFMKGFLINFILKSEIVLNESQKQFVAGLIQEMLTNIPDSTDKKILVLLCMIKSGNKDQLQYLNDSVTRNLILQFKHIFGILHLTQFGEIIQFLITKAQQLNSEAWKLIQQIIEAVQRVKDISPESYNHLTHQITNGSELIRISTLDQSILCLSLIKRNQSIKQYQKLYFRLIKNLVDHVTGNNTQLEIILKEVNGITLKSAYDMKKQIKLKIIGVLDQNSHKNQSVSHQNQNGSHKKQNTIQKNTGVYFEDHSNNSDPSKQEKNQQNNISKNLMGFFNQAIKKIKSQASQKKEPSILDQQEKVQYDPINKVYLCNGKPIQNNQQESNTADETSVKKKVLPPPPPTRFLNKQINRGVSQEIEKPEILNKKQFSNLDQEVGNDQSQIQVDSQIKKPSITRPPPPPPRVGLRGLGGAKPKIQARYV